MNLLFVFNSRRHFLGVCTGLDFLRSNIHKMEKDDPAHMPIGFEIVFPAMVDDARALGLDLPCHEPILQLIYAEREKKMKK